MASPKFMTFNILVKKDGDLYTAHCLELDIVSAAKTEANAMEEIVDLIKAQIDYVSNYITFIIFDFLLHNLLNVVSKSSKVKFA